MRRIVGAIRNEAFMRSPRTRLAALAAYLACTVLTTAALAQGDREHRDHFGADRGSRFDAGDAVPDPTGWHDRWVQLGTRTVEFRGETDVIPIGRSEGRFRNIALVVRRGEVYVHGVRVRFANGEIQNINIRERYSAGGRTGPLDLEGDARVVDSVELLYRAVEGGHRGGPALVEVWGEKAGWREQHHEHGSAPAIVAPPREQWVQLGCQKVAFLDDHDVLQVGRDAGRFSALKLSVTGTKVDVHRMRVIYANGERDELPVQQEIHSGAESAPVELRGARRAIERIELDYASKPSFKGEATACVLGRLE